MKTFGRILIILAAFAIVMGVTYLIVNAGSAAISENTPAFERGGGRESLPDGVQPQFANGQQPGFRGGDRGELRGEGRGGGWMFRMIKNGGIIAVIMALIVIPKRIWRRKSRNLPTSAG